jgi:uncharacterized protein YlaI
MCKKEKKMKAKCPRCGNIFITSVDNTIHSKNDNRKKNRPVAFLMCNDCTEIVNNSSVPL